MKLLTLTFAGVLALGTLITAAPNPDPEVIAFKAVERYQREYQDYILKTLRKRKTGCTTKTLIRRKEWFVLFASRFMSA